MRALHATLGIIISVSCGAGLAATEQCPGARMHAVWAAVWRKLRGFQAEAVPQEGLQVGVPQLTGRPPPPTTMRLCT